MRFSIRFKLLSGFSAVIILMLGLGGLSYRALGQVTAATDELASTAGKLMEVSGLSQAILGLRDVPTHYAATGFRDDQAAFQTDASAAKKLLKDRRGKATRAETKAVYDEIEKSLSDLTRTGTSVLGVADPLTNPQTQELLPKLDSDASAAEADVNRLDDIYRHDDDVARQMADKLKTQTDEQLLIVLIFAAALAAAIALVLAQSISVAVQGTAAVALRLADGDLTVPELKIRSRDEIGDMARAFNNMVKSLRDLIGRVTQSAETIAASSQQLMSTSEEVAAAAQEVARTVSQVAEGASSQSSSVQETTATIEQLRTAIGQIASGAQEQASNAQHTSQVAAQVATALSDVEQKATDVSTSSQRATETARGGAEVVERTVAGMSRIRAKVLRSAEKIRELGQVSEQVGQITAVITEIVDQTNLLALNAAIEAARAGEHGKGFAVVADEVRKLAERAGTSAKEITNLVQAIQNGTDQAVKAMEDGTAEVETGSRLAGDAGTALHEILTVIEQAKRDADAIRLAAQQVAAANQEVVEAVESVAAITQENTAATEEMAAGSDQVTESIENVAALSEENAAAAEEVSASVEEMNASTEEIAASAQSLAGIAQELQQQVARFRL
ncbi:MAG: methyl-accepting chemotaxis protein [Symbiobacteriia bacterium]